MCVCFTSPLGVYDYSHYRICVSVIIGTGGDAPRTAEELQGTRVPDSSGGTRKSTRLTSKYVLRGKTKKSKINIRQLK